MNKMTILTIIIFLFFSSISPPAKIIEIEKEVPVHDTIIEYRSVYDWQKEKRYKIKNEQVVRNMDIVANKILQLLDWRFGIIKDNVCSFCRDWKKGSQHTLGQAVDLLEGKEVFEFIRDSLEYDQLIVYGSVKRPTHIHVSYVEGNNRMEILLARWGRRGYYYKGIK